MARCNGAARGPTGNLTLQTTRGGAGGASTRPRDSPDGMIPQMRIDTPAAALFDEVPGTPRCPRSIRSSLARAHADLSGSGPLARDHAQRATPMGTGEHRVITEGYDARKNDASIGSSRGVISADAHVSRTTARCGAHLVERRLAHHRMARHAHGRGGLLTTRFGSTFPHPPSPSRRILAPGHLLTTARLVVTPDHRRPHGWPSRPGRTSAAEPRSIGDQQPSS